MFLSGPEKGGPQPVPVGQEVRALIEPLEKLCSPDAPDAFLHLLCRSYERYVFLPDCTIFEEGDAANFMIFFLSGTAESIAKGPPTPISREHT